MKEDEEDEEDEKEGLEEGLEGEDEEEGEEREEEEREEREEGEEREKEKEKENGQAPAASRRVWGCRARARPAPSTPVARGIRAQDCLKGSKRCPARRRAPRRAPPWSALGAPARRARAPFPSRRLLGEAPRAVRQTPPCARRRARWGEGRGVSS